MKTINKIMTFILLTAFSLLLMNCEYDVAQPKWYDDYTSPAIPVITSMSPADSAVGGDNYITIYGSNFASSDSSNLVYFDNVKVDVIDGGDDFLTVRRPNLSANGITIKVVSFAADQVAKFENPYKVTSVFEQYGGFIENQTLNAIAVDANGNVFVVDSTTKDIVSSDANGDRVTHGTANRAVYDMAFGNDGNLYMFCNNRAIDFLDVNTNVVDRWSRMPSGKMVQCGDFTDDGYLFTGGIRTGLLSVKVDDQTVTDTGIFAMDQIKHIRVGAGYVYAVVTIAVPDASHPEEGIWRMAIGTDGSVGEPELIVDITANTSKIGNGVSDIFLNANGTLFISVDSEQPMLAMASGTDNLDYFYKDILPTYCKDMCWGNDNYAYVITGDSHAGEDWTVHRIDMGSALK